MMRHLCGHSPPTQGGVVPLGGLLKQMGYGRGAGPRTRNSSPPFTLRTIAALPEYFLRCVCVWRGESGSGFCNSGFHFQRALQCVIKFSFSPRRQVVRFD